MESQSFFNKGYVQTLVVIVLIGVACALFAYTKNSLEDSKYGMMGPTTISVTGEGKALAVPDIGEFSFSVRAEGDDAATAQNKSAETMNAILAYLKDAGVDEKDIKTQNYNLNPKYRYETRTCPANSYCPPGDPIIDGYEVSQYVTVKVRDLDTTGNLISGVGEKGATNISSLQFTIDDESNIKAEARSKAIADARAKADALAKDLGVKVVRIVSFYENEGGYPQPYYAMGGDMALARSESATAPDVPTGENEMTSTVNITYEIR